MAKGESDPKSPYKIQSVLIFFVLLSQDQNAMPKTTLYMCLHRPSQELIAAHILKQNADKIQNKTNSMRFAKAYDIVQSITTLYELEKSKTQEIINETANNEEWGLNKGDLISEYLFRRYVQLIPARAAWWDEKEVVYLCQKEGVDCMQQVEYA